MKNIILFLICVIILFFCFKSCNGGSTKAPKAKNAIVLTGMQGINYGIYELPSNMTQYLKEKSELKTLLNDNRKKVVVYFVGMGCPYGIAFSEAIDLQKKKSEYKPAFEFFAKDITVSQRFDSPEEAQLFIDFYNTCRQFCVINPKKNQLFSIEGVGTKEAQRLPDILDQLKNW